MPTTKSSQTITDLHAKVVVLNELFRKLEQSSYPDATYINDAREVLGMPRLQAPLDKGGYWLAHRDLRDALGIFIADTAAEFPKLLATALDTTSNPQQLEQQARGFIKMLGA